ncbi:hypothetical protein OLMES_1805 [Oleiphilus messinensis]|uniref:Uncharacterized protein n=1 Tax=Oleiphilus messinensis TaxID=141451 RepID=A0A1Y0I6R2_9GAMM|nr:hypothetical protein OLMES_1805 [Oleiphilus messinensis]
MIKAYWLSGTDNGSDFYDLIPESLLCKDCRTIWDKEYVRPVFNLKKNLEVSSTYDNVKIVPKFCKQHCT